MSTTTFTEPTRVLPDATSLGATHLIVADLDRAASWYATALGFHPMTRDAVTATLGDGSTAAVVLHEDPSARPPGREAGLYHVALLYPSREELARAAARLAQTRTPIQGASDHRTHEAIYLADADGNGLELAADRPRAAWPADLGYSAGPAPLDFVDLMRTVEGEAPRETIAPGLRTGHLHLHVNDIDAALAFYRDGLGFDVTAHLGTAVFMSAGGYHHHLAVNVWRGAGIPPAGPGTLGLHHWTVELPSAADVEAARARLVREGVAVGEVEDGLSATDPAGMTVHVVAAT